MPTTVTNAVSEVWDVDVGDGQIQHIVGGMEVVEVAGGMVVVAVVGGTVVADGALPVLQVCRRLQARVADSVAESLGNSTHALIRNERGKPRNMHGKPRNGR